jgi:hypothetical protein
MRNFGAFAPRFLSRLLWIRSRFQLIKAYLNRWLRLETRPLQLDGEIEGLHYRIIVPGPGLRHAEASSVFFEQKVQTAAPRDTLSSDLTFRQFWPWSSRRSEPSFELWAEAYLPIRGGIETYVKEELSSMVQRRLQKALKEPHQFKIDSTLERFELFYEELYRPLLKLRHGQDGLPTARDSFLRQAGRTTDVQLLFIENAAGETIAGVFLIVYRLTELVKIFEYGVRSALIADKEAFQKIYALMNYYSIRFAFERRFKAVSFGYSKAVLNDGGYFYKKQWGCTFRTTSRINHMQVEAVGLKAADLLESRPLLMFEGDQPVAVVGLSVRASIEPLFKSLKSYRCAGMNRLYLVTSQELFVEVAARWTKEGSDLELKRWRSA